MFTAMLNRNQRGRLSLTLANIMGRYYFTDLLLRECLRLLFGARFYAPVMMIELCVYLHFSPSHALTPDVYQIAYFDLGYC